MPSTTSPSKSTSNVTVDDHMTDERWNPGECSLADYRAAGDITAYPVFDRTTPAGLTAMGLLRQVRQHGEH